MKTRFLLSSLIVTLGIVLVLSHLSSCDKIKEAVKFKVKYNLPDCDIPVDSATFLKTEMALYSKTLTINIDSILGANSGKLDSVSFYKIKLWVVSPATVNLDWINSARMTLTPAGGSPIEVATCPSVAPLVRSVDFVVNKVDISSAMHGSFRIDVYGSVKPPFPTRSFKMLLQSGIELTISPLG